MERGAVGRTTYRVAHERNSAIDVCLQFWFHAVDGPFRRLCEVVDEDARIVAPVFELGAYFVGRDAGHPWLGGR